MATRKLRLWARLFVGASIAACGAHLHGAESEAPAAEAADDAKEETKEELTPEQMFEGGEEIPGNWVEISYGGMLTSGSKGTAQQRMHLGEGMFGGIEDLHYQKQVNKETVFSTDLRALPGEEDYRLSLSLVREKLGFVRFHFEQFRTWYNNPAGHFEPSPFRLPAHDESLFIDRGEIGFTAGLTRAKLPQITFEYLHQFRDGEKGSTAWGPVNLGFHPPNLSIQRNLAPSFWDIDETRDIFALDLRHPIKKTEAGVGVRYEVGNINNARKMNFRPSEPNERKVTHREGSSHDLFSAHAWTETWLKNNLMFSSGFLFANLHDSLSGRRVYGDDFDVNYSPAAANGAGFVNLDGVMNRKEYVMNLNLMTIPLQNLTIIPSMRVQKEDWDAESFANPTTGNNPPAPMLALRSNGDALDVQERLDVRYTGVTNWVLYARGEWTQGEGQLDERGGIPANARIRRDTETERLFQKYTIGARWYPMRALTFDAGAYYKRNSYDYDHELDTTVNDSANRYPAYLVMQAFETFDGNLRATWRPLTKLTVSGRYEYQLSTINTRPASASGLAERQSSEMTSQIVGGNASWVPWSRMSLQLGANYVQSQTETPVADLDFTRAALASQNNYWTFNMNTTFVVDNKTDLSLGYFRYEADNFRTGLGTEGFSLGAETAEHGVSAMLTRRLTPNLRWKMRYSWYTSEDDTYGAQNDFDAHMLFTSMQYRF